MPSGIQASLTKPLNPILIDNFVRAHRPSSPTVDVVRLI
jgi:hypothetical protein